MVTGITFFATLKVHTFKFIAKQEAAPLLGGALSYILKLTLGISRRKT